MARSIQFDKIGEVMKYRKLKFSFRQISRLMKADVKTVYRWYLRGVGRYPLSTGKTLQ